MKYDLIIKLSTTPAKQPMRTVVKCQVIYTVWSEGESEKSFMGNGYDLDGIQQMAKTRWCKTVMRMM